MTTSKNISIETKSAIRTYIALSEKFKDSYFWRAPSSASQRRHYENSNSFEYEGDNIKLSFKVSCSCKNIYVSKSVLINGEQKNIRSLGKYVD